MFNLKVFKILEPVSREFLEIAAKRMKLDLTREYYKNYVHPQEDYLLRSEKYPIFAVADGVTLELDKEGEYPNPSGAGEVARIFCEEIVKAAEKIYDKFNQTDIELVFKKANGAVGEYNRTQGRTKKTINFWDFDLFAATSAFAVIKDRIVYWVSICDSYVMHFDQGGQLKFKSPECWPRMRQNISENWRENETEEEKERDRRIKIRSIYRNGVDENGNLIGYGVVTGEETAMKYLNRGLFKISGGDLIFLFTDGFEHYLELPEFVGLFKKWPADLAEKVKKFTVKKSKENPEKFGHERSLIAIFFKGKL